MPSSRTVYVLVILPSSKAFWTMLTGGRGGRSDPLEYSSLASARRARDRIVREYRYSDNRYGHGDISIAEKFGGVLNGEIRDY